MWLKHPEVFTMSAFSISKAKIDLHAVEVAL